MQRSQTINSQSWSPPPHDFVKINVDASGSTNAKVGLGSVIRDSFRDIKAAALKWIEPTSVEVAEVEVARYGMELARRLGFNRIILEGDVANVILAIKSQNYGLSPISVVYKDIELHKAFFNVFECSLVRRSENVVAHCAA
ncbi:3-(3-hydroxy-phenyl)propionate/3-hydroxycinnamic acid hydroxylase [Bienertia sinuspersici]